LATLLSLLTLAALGMPPFGVFAGFMGLLLHPSLPLTGAVCVVLFAWLIASWYYLELMQRLLFGRHRPDLRYEDLRRSEFASLLLLVLILIALGMAPSSLFHATGS
jgi:NADH-quinone oxidoreductase subunit M